MKKMKMIASLILLGTVLLQSNAYALGCEVDFRAKRMVEDTRWFGTVKRPEFKSGTASGQGADLRACTRDALADIKAEGWNITYQSVRAKE